MASYFGNFLFLNFLLFELFPVLCNSDILCWSLQFNRPWIKSEQIWTFHVIVCRTPYWPLHWRQWDSVSQPIWDITLSHSSHPECVQNWQEWWVCYWRKFVVTKPKLLLLWGRCCISAGSWIISFTGADPRLYITLG